MKCVIIVRKNVELGLIVADVFNDYKNGDVEWYRNLYSTELFEVLSVNVVDRFYMSLG